MSGKKPKWDQAQEALQASRVLLEEGLYRDCISRAYYATRCLMRRRHS